MLCLVSRSCSTILIVLSPFLVAHFCSVSLVFKFLPDMEVSKPGPASKSGLNRPLFEI